MVEKETFKDEKGTFHCEPIVWGDWEEGDEVIFDGFTNNLHNHWSFNIGCTYPVADVEGIVGPISFKGEIPSCDWGFKFSRKVYDVAEESVETENKQEKSLDNLLKELHNLKQEEKAISNKIDNILNEINDVMKENGLAIVFTEKFNPHEYRA